MELGTLGNLCGFGLQCVAAATPTIWPTRKWIAWVTLAFGVGIIVVSSNLYAVERYPILFQDIVNVWYLIPLGMAIGVAASLVFKRRNIETESLAIENVMVNERPVNAEVWSGLDEFRMWDVQFLWNNIEPYPINFYVDTGLRNNLPIDVWTAINPWWRLFKQDANRGLLKLSTMVKPFGLSTVSKSALADYARAKGRDLPFLTTTPALTESEINLILERLAAYRSRGVELRNEPINAEQYPDWLSRYARWTTDYLAEIEKISPYRRRLYDTLDLLQNPQWPGSVGQQHNLDRSIIATRTEQIRQFIQDVENRVVRL